MGDYKLIGHENHGWRLYNIAQDIGETTDLSDQYPEKVALMKKVYLDWEKDHPDAQWPSLPRYIKLKSKLYQKLLNNN